MIIYLERENIPNTFNAGWNQNNLEVILQTIE